jgi:hypothetical protein
MTRELYTKLLSLQMVGIVIGALLVGMHLFAILKPLEVQGFLKGFPRHKNIGIAILAIDLIWAFWLVNHIDLGEFSGLRVPLHYILPAAFVGIVIFVDEFLAVRALGVLMLLLACPLLDVAFLKPVESRLFLSILAYVWIIAALFWVGMPYVLRDQINWVSKSPGRWKALAIGGVVYGIIILICSFTFWSETKMAAM